MKRTRPRTKECAEGDLVAVKHVLPKGEEQIGVVVRDLDLLYHDVLVNGTVRTVHRSWLKPLNETR